MKCMFQDCPLDSTKIVPCKIGITEDSIDVYVCKNHYDLLFNKCVNVSMELKEEKND